MRIGFYVWNPFQIYQIQSIAEYFPDSEYILQRKKDLEFKDIFSEGFLTGLNKPIRVVTSGKNIEELDRRYDAIICQTPFGKMEELKHAKIIAMQYSMTKERHQYGTWRTLCDLNLVYGRYSYERISPLSPCVMVGNPRFDLYFENRLDEYRKQKLCQALDPNKRTVLYLPTWGEISSIPQFGSAIAKLVHHYNVIVKVHHNTDILEKNKISMLSSIEGPNIFGANDDLLYLMQAADVVLSDFSGAIFDALNVGKSVILLQKDINSLLNVQKKFGLESIEYARRNEIGPVVEDERALTVTIENILADNKFDYREANERIRKQAFSQQVGCGKAAADAITTFLEAPIKKLPYQIYLQDTFADARKMEAKFKRANKVIKKDKKIIFQNNIIDTFKRIFFGGVHLIKKYSRSTINIVIFFFIRLLILPYKTKYQSFFGPFFTRIVNFLDAELLKELALQYDSYKNRELSLFLSRLCFEKNKKVGYAQYIFLLKKYKKTNEIRGLVDSFLSLPIEQKSKLLFRLEGLTEIVNYRTEDVRQCRQDILLDHIHFLKSNKKSKKSINVIKVLLSNRLMQDASEYLSNIELSPKIQKSLFNKLNIHQERMKEWAFLTNLANANHRPGLKKTAYKCFFKNEVINISEVCYGSRVVEFMLPPYFYSENVVDKTVHASICTMLCQILDLLHDKNIAIVPRHQFRLDHARPTGYWPVISYHTKANTPGWFHIKDAHIPGYFSVDSGGYSGWSSLSSLCTLPEATPKDIDQVWERIQTEIINEKLSKYSQKDSKFIRPNRPYIFLPMQLLNDTVATLAYISCDNLAKILADILPKLGYDLVIKRHPLCTSLHVDKILCSLKRNPHVHIVTASIHEILPMADAVVTVNSGVGFEALLYGKKVILSGKSDYAFATENCKNKEQLLTAIQNINQPVDLARIKSFLHFYMTQYVFNFQSREDLEQKILRIFGSEYNISQNLDHKAQAMRLYG